MLAKTIILIVLVFSRALLAGPRVAGELSGESANHTEPPLEENLSF